jgi:hypothetical protein
MKKITFLFLSLLLVRSSFAQITLTQADLPVIGESLTSHFDYSSSPSQLISSPGGNQVWDFSSGWNVAGSVDINYVSPSSLDGAANFPNSTIGFLFGNTSSFLQSTSSGMFLEGQYTNIPGTGTIIEHHLNDVAIVVPLSYGSNYTFSRTSSRVEIYSSSPALKRVIIESGNVECDAWGTLTTPSLTANSLRLRETINQTIDSAFVDSSGTGNNFVVSSVYVRGFQGSYSYTFYKQAPQIMMMAIEADSASGVITLEEYYDQSGSGLDVLTETPSLRVYPNPVKDLLHFRNEKQVEAQLYLYDSSGKECWNYNLSGIQDLTVSSDKFSNGVYFYRLIGRSGNVLASGKVSVQH